MPTSPGDGQEAILVDSVINPTYQWHFRYNSNNASAYKWEFVGGASLRGFGGSLTLTTLMTTPTNLTGGPSLTVPRSGIYQCRYGAFHANNTTFVGAYTTMTQTYVGAVQVGTPLQTSHSATWQGASIAIITDLTLTANDVVNLKAWLDRTGNQSTVSNGWLELIPVRVS